MHDYISMRLDYGTKGKVRITMPKHIKIIVEAVVEYIDSISETPEDNDMLTVIEYGDTLTGT